MMNMNLSLSWGKPTKTTVVEFWSFNCNFPFSRWLIANEGLQKTIFGYPFVVAIEQLYFFKWEDF